MIDDLDDDDIAKRAEKLAQEWGAGKPAPAIRLDTDEERRWAAKLLAGRTEKARYSDDDLKVARKLFGSDNAERMKRTRDGRQVRMVPVVEKVEWYWWRTGDLRPDEWRIERIVNGRKEEVFRGTEMTALRGKLAEFRRLGISVRQIVLESEIQEDKARESHPTPKHKKRSVKFDLLQKLRRFKR